MKFNWNFQRGGEGVSQKKIPFVRDACKFSGKHDPYLSHLSSKRFLRECKFGAAPKYV